MPTGQTLIDNALTKLAINELGGTPSSSDSTAGLSELNNLWSAWSIDEGLINQVVAARFPLSANVGVYTIGPAPPTGGQPSFNASRPARIYKAYFCRATAGAIATQSIGDGGSGYAVNDTGVILGATGSQATYTVNTVNAGGAVLTLTISGAGTGYVAGNGYLTQPAGAQPGIGAGLTLNILTVTAGGETRTELKVVNADTFYAHRDLQASAYTSDELFPDYLPDGDGFSRLYLFPVPVVATAAMLELSQSVNFAPWTLTGNQNLAAGYQDPMEWALAARLIGSFGAIVPPQIQQQVMQEGVKAEQRIRQMNRANRQLLAGTEQLPPLQEQQQAAKG